jgi:hypothetical protein
MGRGLLSIGQSSALCRLSPKALRLYNELELVAPACDFAVPLHPVTVSEAVPG